VVYIQYHGGNKIKIQTDTKETIMKIQKLILQTLLFTVTTIGLAIEQTDSTPVAQEKTKATQSVQKQVDTEAKNKADTKRSHVYEEALQAVVETNNALAALRKDKPDTKAALAALEKSTGKIAIILAREPDLAFAPLDVTVETYDFLSSVDTIKAMIHDIDDLIDDGQIQEARAIMENLVSEIDINTTSLPLVSYPLATTEAADLIDENKINEAIIVLETQLNTLVNSEEIIPLPILRAELLLASAEEIITKKNRSDDEQEKLADLLDEARTQLLKGNLLGYLTKADYKSLNKEIEKLEDKASQNTSGKDKGWFDTVKEKVENLFK
jgi:hypothetical protein